MTKRKMAVSIELGEKGGMQLRCMCARTCVRVWLGDVGQERLPLSCVILGKQLYPSEHASTPVKCIFNSYDSLFQILFV